ncbi:hypothetical protein J132_09593 [Termitomyces sp. J132]|nr:hypothetical protein J132_09593 [Termitomyces sp. J132]
MAESTISVSQFPQPPASLPSTLILSEFGSPFPTRSNLSPRSAPLGPRKPLTPGASNASTYSFAPKNSKNKTSELDSSGRSGLSGTSTFRPPSPHLPSSSVPPSDQYDGISSIGMDATEDRLLSTSFITSLLKENSSFRANKRQFFASDALSNFSEMTYPPLASSYATDTIGAAGSSSFDMRLPTDKDQAGQPPLGPLASIHESPIPALGDSATLYRADPDPSVPRKASFIQKVQRNSEIYNLPSDHIPSHHDGSNPVHSDPHACLALDSIGVVTPRFPRPTTTSDLQDRNSMHSTKSVVTSFVSRLSSHHSIKRVLAWKKVKPLPPVPLIAHIPIATELDYRRAEEMACLSDLVNRANTLEGYLKKGYQPHQSVTSFLYHAIRSGEGLVAPVDDADTVLPDTTGRTTPAARFRVPTQPQWSRYSKSVVSVGPAPLKKRRNSILLGAFFIVCLVAAGTAVGITIGRKKASTAVCPTNRAGAACNLNSTCICTSTQSGHCDPLPQNIIDLVPSLNRVFLSNRTSNDVYNNIRLTQSSANCASQSVLVDVAPALTSQISENVTRWAQTALLWNMIESQNLTANAALQKFIQTAPWHALNTTGEASLFTIMESGFIFDFAALEVREPNVSFVVMGQPAAAQLSQTGSTARSALDRMYSFASASSTQHQKALENYWTSVLQQNLSDLRTFMTALSISPIYLPFDATLTQQPMSLHSLLTPSSSAPFPPPLSCYPSLNSSQLQLINAIEGPVFGLSSVSPTNHFDPACYPGRPIYGVLNVLRLRQPFLDPRLGIARQAAVLKRDVSPRAIIRPGAILSLLPGPSNVSVISVEQSDPRQYGTLGQFHHVALQYLSSIPRVEVASALVSYILASGSIQAVPPTSTSILFNSLSTIPIIEVAVFGTVSPSDISFAASAFTTSSGSLFFGSDEGTALRNWVITGCSDTTIWAESPISPLVVRDSSFSDQIFNQTWNTVSMALHDSRNIGLVNITDNFITAKKFSSS